MFSASVIGRNNILNFIKMNKVKQISKEQLLEAAEKFIDLLFEKIHEELLDNQAEENAISSPEKHLTFKEVCDYYRISKTTLEIRIREGLKFNQARKNCNRTFKFSECEKFLTKNL
jgi:hypothetical protein